MNKVINKTGKFQRNATTVREHDSRNSQAIKDFRFSEPSKPQNHLNIINQIVFVS